MVAYLGAGTLSASLLIRLVLLPTHQKAVPFLLEDKLKELGGIFSKADADWASHVVRYGQSAGAIKAKVQAEP